MTSIEVKEVVEHPIKLRGKTNVLTIERFWGKKQQVRLRKMLI